MTIEPLVEAYGEGNGWEYAAENTATLWVVWDGDRQLDAFDTRLAAETYIASEDK